MERGGCEQALGDEEATRLCGHVLSGASGTGIGSEDRAVVAQSPGMYIFAQHIAATDLLVVAA